MTPARRRTTSRKPKRDPAGGPAGPPAPQLHTATRSMSLPSILVLTTEPPPLPGLATTGAGLRAWGLANGLRSAGFERVTLAFAADAVRGREGGTEVVPWVRQVERAGLVDLVSELRPDAIVFQHWGMMRDLRRDPGCPVAVDLAGPHLLERRLWGSKDPAGDRREKLAALSRADHVVCSGQFQRCYFVPFLMEAGFDARSKDLCPVIPFSLSPELPEAAPDRSIRRVFFGGMFLPWQDPAASIERTLRVVAQHADGGLVFVGGPHPSLDVSEGRFDALMERLSKDARVERHGVLPFDRMLGLMRGCGLALDLMPQNPERLLAFPTRTITYMWSGLPVLHNNYDELARPIEAGKAGWTFPPDEPDLFESSLSRIMRSQGEIQRRSENAQRLVRAEYTWDRTIGPLAEWCKAPARRTRPAVVALPGDLAAPPEPGAGPQSQSPARRERRERVGYSPRVAVTGPNRHAWLLSPIVFLLALPISMMLVAIFALGELVRRLATRR